MAEENEISAQVLSLIKGGPGEKPADVVEPPKLEEAAEEKPAVDEKPAEVEKPVFQPGTPDKATQKLQQDLATAIRKLDSLAEKKESGQALSEKDQQELDRNRQRIEKIKASITAKSFGVIEGGSDLAEQVLELTGKTGEIDELKQQVADLNERLDGSTATSAWSKAKDAYPGVDVAKVWDNAVKEAEQTLGDDADPNAIHRLASRDFHRAASGAAKRTTKKEEPPKKTTSAGGAQVSAADQSVAAIPADNADANYESLVTGLIQKQTI